MKTKVCDPLLFVDIQRCGQKKKTYFKTLIDSVLKHVFYFYLYSPYSLALDQGDCFLVSDTEHHTDRQLLTLSHRYLCYSYAELARAVIEPGTLRFLAERSTNWVVKHLIAIYAFTQPPPHEQKAKF